MNENQSFNSPADKCISTTETVHNKSQQAAIATSSCCEFFVDALNDCQTIKSYTVLNVEFQNRAENKSCSSKQIVINDQITLQHIDSYLNYCHVWQEK